MRLGTWFPTLIIVAVGASACVRGSAQAVPTATQRLQLSAFGGISGVYTGFNSGRNLGITAGIDLGIRPVYSLFPSLEARGTYPLDKGQTDNQRNILFGLKLARHYRRFHPYADFLFGRGEIQYPNGYDTPNRDFFYTQSTSNVFSPGVGFDLQLANHFSFKVDAQFQRYSSPVANSGHVLAKAVTFGSVYRFSFGEHRRR